MNTQEKITISQWNMLSKEGKEKLRIWAVNNGHELDVIPSTTESFDPACEYAALLSEIQLVVYITLAGESIDKRTCKDLWNKVVNLVESN